MRDVRAAITGEVRAAFDEDLARADEQAAVALTMGLLTDGVSAEEVLLDLVAPAQVAVGARWATGEWTVAQEHAATHISEASTAAVAEVVARRRDPGGSTAGVVAACTDGEWHTLPARILSEVLRLRGFHVRFLGGDVPAAQLVSDLHRSGPAVVALSCILPVHLPHAHHLVEISRLSGVPVLAGGPGFGPGGVWARTLGADLYAADAAGAADLLRGQWPPRLSGAPSVRASSVEAYARLVRHRSALLGGLIEGLCERNPELRRLTDQEYRATVDTLGHLLDSLAAGVFVDDPRVFTGYLSFAVQFFAARCADPGSLGSLVDTLAGLLGDFPRAHAHVAAGQRLLAA
jgi:MerR family transcriptional regulator, light-induced transcriptional regulator